MSFWQDLRFAVRDLRKGILVSTLAVLSLALAIGGNTTVFSFVNALLFRPLPYPEPHEIVLLGEREEAAAPTVVASAANLVDWRERNRSFEDVAGFRPAPMSLGAGERPEPIIAAQVSPGFFDILGAEPLRGRTFREDDGRDGAHRVVVLGHRFWRDRYDEGVDPSGDVLVLNREPYTIVGILPGDFEFFNPQVQLWVPLVLDRAKLSRDSRDTVGLARLRDGVTTEQAKDDIASIHRALESEFPESNRGFVVDLLNFQYDIPDRRGRIMFGLLQGALVFVLLIACVNIANLLLARTQARRREIALRTALGASRRRVVRQLLTESLILAVLGGALGLALGVAGNRLLARSFADAIPTYWVPVIDARVLAMTLGLTALAGVLFGLSPAWMSFKVNLSEAVKEGGRGSAGTSRRFVSRALVVAQIALSIVLLGGGSVLVQSFLALRHSDPGFDMDDLLTVTVSLPEGDDVDRALLTERLVERAESLPGVTHAAASSALPQNVFITTIGFSPDDRQPVGEEALPRAILVVSSPEYLETLGFPVLRGRFFTKADREELAAVAVVSQALADRHWPRGEALGRRVTIQGVSREIIGVVGDVRQSVINQGESSQGAIYVPVAQQPITAPFLLLRTRVEPASLSGSVRNELVSVDSRVSIGQIQTMNEFVDQFFVGANFFNSILTGFGVLALLLASLGTYGVLAYNVSQRSQEFGVRMALGAGPERILRLVTRQGIKLGLLGLLIGAPGVIGVARIINSILVYSPPVNPLTILGVFVVLFLATFAASYIPARRAALLDPVIVLRQE